MRRFLAVSRLLPIKYPIRLPPSVSPKILTPPFTLRTIRDALQLIRRAAPASRSLSTYSNGSSQLTNAPLTIKILSSALNLRGKLHDNPTLRGRRLPTAFPPRKEIRRLRRPEVTTEVAKMEANSEAAAVVE